MGDAVVIHDEMPRRPPPDDEQDPPGRRLSPIARSFWKAFALINIAIAVGGFVDAALVRPQNSRAIMWAGTLIRDYEYSKGWREGYDEARGEYANLKSTVTMAHLRCNSQGGMELSNIFLDGASPRINLDKLNAVFACPDNTAREH